MAGRFCGQSDPDLNAQGRAQLMDLARLLSAETIEGVYSSDLRRALNTARAIAEDRSVPLSLRPALREIDFGQWEGLSWAQIEQRYPEYSREWAARLSTASGARGRRDSTPLKAGFSQEVQSSPRLRPDRGGHACGSVACGLAASVRLLRTTSLGTNQRVLLRHTF